MKKNILTVGLIALLLVGVLTSGCIGEEKSSTGGEEEEALVTPTTTTSAVVEPPVTTAAPGVEEATAATPTPTVSAVIAKWESDKAEAGLVKVVNFLLSNEGKEIEVAGEKHRITGKEKLDIVAKMADCCAKEKLNDLMSYTESLKGEVKSSNLDERLWHASMPADQVQILDAVWNIERIDLEPEARAIWMPVVGLPVTTQPPITETLTTTSPPTTTPAPTTAPSLWTDKPAFVIPRFEGSKTFEIENEETVQVGDALIYFSFEPELGGCGGPQAWELSIFKATDEGGIYEGSEIYTDEKVKPHQDITKDIHEISNALDDYTIVVEEWPREEIRLTLTYKI